MKQYMTCLWHMTMNNGERRENSDASILTPKSMFLTICRAAASLLLLWQSVYRNEENKKESYWGFPGGAVVENLPANAGDTGSSPGLGRSHMPRSSWAREPQLLSLRVWSLCSATSEAAIVRGPRTAIKSGPRLPQLEKALAQKRRPNTTVNK